MCFSVADAISSFFDNDNKSLHCALQILGVLFWVITTVNELTAVCKTHRAVDLEKVSLMRFVADVFARASPSAVASRSDRPN